MTKDGINYHTSVLLKEAIAHLKVQKDQKYIDCNLGDAGHAIEILRQGGVVLALDLDPEAIARSKQRIEHELGKEVLESKTRLVEGNFKDVVELAQANGFEHVNGVLYDVGTSFLQLESEDRGFSFDSDAKLDMRMDPKLGVSAQDLVNALPETELAKLIFKYGEDRFAKRIAKAIVKARKAKPVVTCRELAELIKSSTPRLRGVLIHPATRTFQALRIAVNDELSNLETSLSRVAAGDLLIPGGSVVIITFHSLEDKIAKLPRPGLLEVLKKPQTPSELEVSLNPRSRSAKLRVYQKI